MKSGPAEKAVAVFGDGIDVLLYGYYLQRFGLKTDIYFSESGVPKIASNHLVSTWLCLQRDPILKKIAAQGIAELREIAIDLGSSTIASESGSSIFECRPEYVDALEQFARECRASGLLAEFSSNVRSMGLPHGTMAAVRFRQDVSLYPKSLSNRLLSSFLDRGGAIFRELNFDHLRFVDNSYEMTLGDHSRRYDLVVLGGDYTHGSGRLGDPPSEYPESSMGIFGRCLSFQRATQILKKMDESRLAQPQHSFFEQIFRTGKVAQNTATEHPSWPAIQPLEGVRNVYTVRQSGELAQSVATARALGEFLRFLDAPASNIRHLPTEPQSIPWII